MPCELGAQSIEVLGEGPQGHAGLSVTQKYLITLNDNDLRRERHNAFSKLVPVLLLLFLFPGLPPLLLLLLSFNSLGVHDRCSVYNTAAVPYHTGSCDCYRHFLQWQPLQLG